MQRSDKSRLFYRNRSQLLATPANRVIKVLMISNNPHEMGCLSLHLRNFKWKKFAVRATFDLKNGLLMAQSFKPDYLLVDGSLGEESLRRLVQEVRSKKATWGTAIAILKDYRNAQLLVPGIQDYLMKENIASDTFPFHVLHAIMIKRNEERISGELTKGSTSWWPKYWGLGKKLAVS